MAGDGFKREIAGFQGPGILFSAVISGINTLSGTYPVDGFGDEFPMCQNPDIAVCNHGPLPKARLFNYGSKDVKKNDSMEAFFGSIFMF